MTDSVNQMLNMARDVMKNSYSPYSKFTVGACILTEDNQYFSGCNIENASYGLTICAEAAAIANMRSQGEHDIKEILVIGSSDAPCAPCGACRQLIREFASEHTQVHMCNSSGEITTKAFNELLPDSFGPEFLGK